MPEPTPPPISEDKRKRIEGAKDSVREWFRARSGATLPEQAPKTTSDHIAEWLQGRADAIAAGQPPVRRQRTYSAIDDRKRVDDRFRPFASVSASSSPARTWGLLLRASREGGARRAVPHGACG